MINFNIAFSLPTSYLIGGVFVIILLILCINNSRRLSELSQRVLYLEEQAERARYNIKILHERTKSLVKPGDLKDSLYPEPKLLDM